MQLDNMTEDQLVRFEFFIRSHFPRSAVKDIIVKALSKKKTFATTAAAVVTDDMAIVCAGLAKLFVGELIELCNKQLVLQSCMYSFLSSLFFKLLQ